MIFLQYVHRKCARVEDARVGVGVSLDADEHELRVEGYGAECVDGEPTGPTGSI